MTSQTAATERADSSSLSSLSSSTSSSSSLQDRILAIIDECPNRIIRPARLAAEVGDLSVEDATAELCSVMAAVGSGATFVFEKTNDHHYYKQNSEQASSRGTGQPPPQQQQHVMVFTFPEDFKLRAKRAKRVQDWKEQLTAMGVFLWKVIQIVTGLGLILSLLILSVTAVLAMIAALIALSRVQQNSHRGLDSHRLMQQVRHVCFTIRELLWCYAMFGPDIRVNADDNDSDGGQEQQQTHQRDPFLREMAHDLALLSSVCCGHPGSVFYWWRVRQLSQRRHHLRRGWRRAHNYYWQDSDVEGVRLIRPARHDDTEHDGDDDYGRSLSFVSTASSPAPQQHRGVLSVAVEFLFGPPHEKQQQRHEQQRKWKLRAAFLVRQSSASTADSGIGIGNGVSLQQLGPYADDPPARLLVSNDKQRRRRQEQTDLAMQGLLIVSHFHGVPLHTSNQNKEADDDNYKNDDSDNKMLLARFIFPELVSESAVALRYDATDQENNIRTELQEEGYHWTSVLYDPQQQQISPSSLPRTLYRNHQHYDDDDDSFFPSYYHEPLRSYTDLTFSQFASCLSMGVLNILGVVWLRQATKVGTGVMDEVVEFRAVARVLRNSLVPVLWFYARLFWMLALSRLIYVMWCNRCIRQRNQHRRAWAFSMTSVTN